MIHQPSGGAQGTASDIEIQAREILYLRAKMNALYAQHTGQPIETIERDMDRDRFMSAEEAKAYGLIDTVISPRAAIVPQNGRQERDLTPGVPGLTFPAPLTSIATWLHVPRQTPPLLVLRQIEGLRPEVHLRAVGLHLQRVHRPLQ